MLAASRTQHSSCSSKQDAKQLGCKARLHLLPPHSFLQLGKLSKTWVEHSLASLRHQWCNYPSRRQEIISVFLLLIIWTTEVVPKDLFYFSSTRQQFLRDCYYQSRYSEKAILTLPYNEQAEYEPPIFFCISDWPGAPRSVCKCSQHVLWISWAGWGTWAPISGCTFPFRGIGTTQLDLQT